MNRNSPTRLQSAEVLSRVIHQKQSLSDALNSLIKEQPQELAKIKALCFGVMRHFYTLNALANLLLSKPLPGKAAVIHALLLQTLHELQEQKSPEHAILNEAVEAAKKSKFKHFANMLNACCRRYLREKDELERKISADQSVHFNHPKWLLKMLQTSYPETWETICSANNQQAPMALRVNQQQISRAAYQTQIAELALSASIAPITQTGIVLDTPIPVTECPGFLSGQVSVQDIAGQLLSTLCDLKPGMRVLDACAAPGSKLCHLLEIEPALQATAVDIEQHRLHSITENLTRLNLQAELVHADSSKLPSNLKRQQFDLILVDAPCSATGVIRRHPDIKYLRRSSDIPKLAKQQLAILRSVWPLLKPSGRLIYSTCSILPVENDAPIAEFMAEKNDVALQTIQADWGIATPIGRQLLPGGENNTDGFFYSVLSKAAFNEESE